ncbi:hypothetical protein H0A61_00740 [Koleobacter methoxysyntrophicus]|uniref:Copper amine oxidase-like N-terminal domain-containing protein n=1 Tax=Koleobacter methoxysyntrophicus TaxID=2751313 RepID=A0A8A0RLC6_9FIRM|nr:stalk domain-containing protein [Koleobacter methoxysyntrophicus]QSQ08418.1 hypothetical protein H0A61_00740 [Koleobacter methoxysyntrophicus]
MNYFKFIGIVLVTIFTLTLIQGNVFSSENGESPKEYINLLIQLGDNIEEEGYKTYYLGSTDAFLNDNKLNLNIEPFIYRWTTYIPIRDISSVFGFPIDYDEKDDLLLISQGDHLLILSKTGGIKHYGNRIEPVNESYIVRRDRAYIPLRLVCEGHDFDVTYIGEKNQVVIRGYKIKGTLNKPAFPSDALEVIEAVNNTYRMERYEFSAKLKDPQGKEENLTGIRNKTALDEGYEVENRVMVEGRVFVTREKFSNNGRSASAFEIKNGLKEYINLLPYGGYHPYMALTDINFQGLSKYSIEGVKLLDQKDSIKTYEIKWKEGSYKKWKDQSLICTIDIDKKLLLLYKVMDRSGELLKEIEFKY